MTEVFCKNCNKQVPQTKGKRKREFCNKKCYGKYYLKTGGYSRAMKKYNSKPKNKEKNRLRANKYFETHKKPKTPKFCEVCGNLLEGRRRTFCSDGCAKKSPRVKAYMREFQRKLNAEKRIKNLEAELIKTKEKSKNATYIISQNKLIRERANKRILRINKTLKELKK